MSVNSRPNYTGTFYWFAGRKRAENTACEGEVKPDTLVLADGTTKYDIVGLDDAKVDELVSTLFHICAYSLAIATVATKLEEFVEVMC